MALRPILRWPDARLSQPCAPVGEITDEIRTLVADMYETMYAAPGRGLAAPQVGAVIRLFVVDVTWKEGTPEPVTMIDPALLAVSDDVCTLAEGCLSIPGISAEVERPAEVRMRWRDLEGGHHEASLTGMMARCAQHELDHLNGLVHFDRISAEQRAILEEAYQ